MLYTAHYKSPVGDIFIAERDGGLLGLWIAGQKHFLESIQEACTVRETQLLTQTKTWLDRYFAGEMPAINELRLTPIGSEFRHTVWQLLCAIPYGETATYGELAKKAAARMGMEKMSAQAVGGAVGHNPISIIIPCHRVVGADGSLTGYAGGLAAKVKLLTHENADMTRLFVPKKGTAL